MTKRAKPHVHALALRIIPRLPLQEVWCPDCGRRVDGVEVELRLSLLMAKTTAKER